MSVLGLFDILYPEAESLPVPDCTKIYATRQVSKPLNVYVDYASIA